mmetsp:Transcript_8893/g.18466  ORF Transcript_8893/g.18466 Transcript_8893/m.18466 type:complete len:245 (+) Transcript_8893:2431-3165(+)
MTAGHQCRIPHHCVLIHDGLFHIPFYGTQHGRIDDIDQYSDGVGAVQRNVASHILGKAGSDNDDIGGIAERLNLLEEKVDYAAEAWVGGNEEFGGREEEFGGFCGSERIVVGTITIGGNIFGIESVVMEVEDLGDDGAAFAGSFANQFVVVKYACTLKHFAFLQMSIWMDFNVIVLAFFSHAYQLFDFFQKLIHFISCLSNFKSRRSSGLFASLVTKLERTKCKIFAFSKGRLLSQKRRIMTRR